MVYQLAPEDVAIRPFDRESGWSEQVPLLNNQAYEVEARGSCDAIFDRYVLCLMNSDCFKSKGPSAGNAELKQCARKNAAGVPEECATLHEAVKLCNRSQV
eukprot:COSAG02_NODE_2498_length_8675_cov_6.885378_7_plen_101_part_00